MPRDREQLTPEEPEDAEHLAANRGQGAAGTGHDEVEEAVPTEELPETEQTEEHTGRR